MNVLHPPFVHFVVALPVAALFAQLTYLATGERTYAKVALRILAFTLLMGIFAFYTGGVDAEKIADARAILPGGLQTLEAHRSFGLWLLAILFAAIVVKWIAASKASRSWEKLALGMILITIAATLYQGNKGGELVYRYSAGIGGKILEKRLQADPASPSKPNTKE
jgi:uncharacterized membrane protein